MQGQVMNLRLNALVLEEFVGLVAVTFSIKAYDVKMPGMSFGIGRAVESLGK